MSKDPVIARSVGFYLIEGFWADKKPDYTKFSSQYWIKPEFWKLMEEEALVPIYDTWRAIWESNPGQPA